DVLEKASWQEKVAYMYNIRSFWTLQADQFYLKLQKSSGRFLQRWTSIRTKIMKKSRVYCFNCYVLLGSRHSGRNMKNVWDYFRRKALIMKKNNSSLPANGGSHCIGLSLKICRQILNGGTYQKE